ncbi:leukocidin family pore-forming toxin [Silvanigrella aquatica]|uniref:Uncharacterized protein n=1 Tax=Silvanigrella aquatica TaxID=1915309 RepID=A0A1L4D1X1_9BACT|nr:leukocidin family pore-forming toxin [Silvanigrella aquatica]APJ04203.1 hypothetical protein AXG55_09910 [Silvanigrella aquatica]
MGNKLKYSLLLSSLIVVSQQSFAKDASRSVEKNIELNERDEICQNSKNYIKIASSADLNSIKELFDRHETLLFDLTKADENEKKKLISLMSKTGALSFQENFVLLRKGHKGPEYTLFENIPTEQELDVLIPKLKFKMAHSDVDILNGSQATIKIVGKNLSCPMRLYYGYSKDLYQKDYCDNNAFVELNYKIDMSGSKFTEVKDPATGKITKTESGKYLMITLSPQEEGGTGWHMADDMTQTMHWSGFSTWYQYLAPFANKYRFWIKHITNNNNVTLVETYPQNSNPEFSVTESRGFTVGLSGGLKGGIDAKGNPSGNIDLGASMQMTNRKDVSYKTQEYSVENNSYDSKAEWIWNAKVDEKICEYLSYRDMNSACYFSSTIFESYMISRKDKFSAISHKAFTPSIQAIFKTKSDENGISTFELGTNADAGVLLGYSYSIPSPAIISMIPLFHKHELDTYTMPNVTRSFSVDWSSPYFASEQTLRLQDVSSIYTTKCVAVKNDNSVFLDDCIKGERAIAWGYDNDTNQFKSRSKNGYCLAVNSESIIHLEECNFNNNQKFSYKENSNDGNSFFIKTKFGEEKIIAADKNDGKLKLISMGSNEVTPLSLSAFQADL